MNTTTAALRNIIGAALVILALSVGALLGSFTSPDNPAHAETPSDTTPTTTACVMCATSHLAGGSGEEPAPLTKVSATVGHAPKGR